MPTRRLFRPWMVKWLERLIREIRRTQPNIPFCVFVIKAHRELNPNYEKTLDKNFSLLEAITAFIGRYLLIQGSRPGEMVPDRNILYVYQRIRKYWNDRARHVRRQVKSNKYDFVERSKVTRRNPDGIEETISYRLLEPERGPIAVALSQRDIDDSMAGQARTRDRLDMCRDEQAVDLAIAELLREYNL